MRYPMLALTVAISTLFGVPPAAQAQVSFGISIALAPGINIGIHVPAYPHLEPVPGYPVYYDPYADSNYFFYDGLYWVFQYDDWYSSIWYNGPWRLTAREYVPFFILRIPVRYYRHPPPYFQYWHRDAPPRWNERWGNEWAQRRPGWDHWDRQDIPRPAPLPSYQRNYSGDRYPRALQQQQELRSRNYRYQPNEEVTREHFRQQEQQRQQQQDRRSERDEWGGKMQQSQPDQQRPRTVQPRAVPPREQAPGQRPPQARPQDKGRDNRSAPRGKDREDKNERKDPNDQRG